MDRACRCFTKYTASTIMPNCPPARDGYHGPLSSLQRLASKKCHKLEPPASWPYYLYDSGVTQDHIVLLRSQNFRSMQDNPSPNAGTLFSGSILPETRRAVQHPLTFALKLGVCPLFRRSPSLLSGGGRATQRRDWGQSMLPLDTWRLRVLPHGPHSETPSKGQCVPTEGKGGEGDGKREGGRGRRDRLVRGGGKHASIRGPRCCLG